MDEDVELLMSMYNALSRDDIDTALADNGLASTGNRLTHILVTKLEERAIVLELEHSCKAMFSCTHPKKAGSPEPKPCTGNESGFSMLLHTA